MVAGEGMAVVVERAVAARDVAEVRESVEGSGEAGNARQAAKVNI